MAAPRKSDRDEQVLADYAAGVSIAELSHKYGISRRRILQITTANGVRRKGPLLGRPEPKVMSKTHAKIGAYLYHYYFRRRMTRSQAAEGLGFSVVKLRMIEQGTFDLTVFDLMKIMEFSHLSPNEAFDAR